MMHAGPTGPFYSSRISSPSLIEQLRENLPPFFSRQFICKQLGGALTPKTLSNLDAMREGPENRICMGKKVLYERESFLDWLSQRVVSR